jgi:hypothetical protein
MPSMQKAPQGKMDLKLSPLWKPNKYAMTKGKINSGAFMRLCNRGI